MMLKSSATVDLRWKHAALIAILILALALRFFYIGQQSLWNDEGTSVALAQRSLAQITQGAAHDIHPPLYYYMLHLWIKVWGTSEMAVRSLSALLGVMLVATIHQLGKRFFGSIVALWAALFAAISPFQIYYSQEARMYMLLCSAGAFSTLAFVRIMGDWSLGPATDHHRWERSAALYLAVSIATVYSHYLGFAVILAQNLTFLICLFMYHAQGQPLEMADDSPHAISLAGIWSSIWPWALLQVIVILAYVPWLLLSWRSLSAWPSVSEPLTPSYLLGEVARMFTFGVAIPERQRFVWIGAALAALAIPCLVGWNRSKEARKKLSQRTGTVLCTLYAATPIVLIYLLSLNRPMYKPKFLLLSTPPFYILQACGVIGLAEVARRLSGKLAQQILTVLFIAGVLASAGRGIWGVYADEDYYRDDYRGIAAYIQAAAGPDDAILINAPAQIETFDYYYQGPLPEYPLPRTRPLDAAQTHGELEQLIQDRERIYAVFWATDESDPEGLIERWLDGHCYKAMDSWFGNVRLLVYAVPQQSQSATRVPIDVTLGDTIQLQSYAIANDQITSGEILQLSLYWQASERIEERYKVFTHLVDARNQIVAQRDSEPGGGNRPTTTWQPGEQIIDNYGILVPPGTLPGEHTLRIGLYDMNTGQRLFIRNDLDPVGDALDLATVPLSLSPVPPPIGALNMQEHDNAQWQGLGLVGHDLNRLGYDHAPESPVHPGDVVSLTLYWQRLASQSIPDEMILSLQSKGRTVWQQPVRVTDGILSDEAWHEGQIVRDKHQFLFPADLEPGRVKLTLGLGGEGRPYTIQSLNISAP